jgi:hypothetical protein
LTTIDFTRALQDAKGASFEALPVGDYDVEVAKSEAVTSQSGKPMIKVTMKVVSGPYERRPIMNQFVMSVENPTALNIFFRHMRAFGLTEEWFASLGGAGSLEPVASALLNRRARLTLGHRDWQGETRNEVKAVKPYTGAPPVAAPLGPSTGPGPVTGPTAPGPLPPAPTAPVAAPLPPPAPPAAVAPPQVQSVPQPPAAPAVPTVPASPTPTYAGPTAPEAPVSSEHAPSSAPAPTAGTSDVPPAPPAPPQLPV